MVVRRLEVAKQGPRPDLLEGLISRADELKLTRLDLTVNSAFLVIAGQYLRLDIFAEHELRIPLWLVSG